MSVNYGSILDTRDLEKRIDELEALKEVIAEAQQAFDDADEEDKESRQDDLEASQRAFDDEQEWDQELAELQSARDEVSEWIHGETMIPEDKWVDYCRELVEDVGDLPKNLPGYIENNINWEGVADDLKADYTTITLDGTDYLVRA